MVEGTELQELCAIGTNENELVQLCMERFDQALNQAQLDQRLQQLRQTYNDARSAQIIYNTIFAS